MGGVRARFADTAAWSCAEETDTNAATRQNAEMKRLIFMRNVVSECGASGYGFGMVPASAVQQPAVHLMVGMLRLRERAASPSSRFALHDSVTVSSAYSIYNARRSGKRF